VSVRRYVSALLSGLLALTFLVFPATSALAAAPLDSLDGLITNQSSTLSAADVSEIEAAQQQFHTATGGQFYVVFVDSFGTTDAEDWAADTARNADLSNRDLLLAVAPDDPNFWLWYGSALEFSASRSEYLENLMGTSLDAGMAGVDTTWGGAVANIIGAFQNEIATEGTVVGTESPPEGAVNDGEGTAVAPGQVDDAGGLPTAVKVLLWVVGGLAALFVLWLLLGRYNEKRLARREQNPFNV